MTMRSICRLVRSLLPASLRGEDEERARREKALVEAARDLNEAANGVKEEARKIKESSDVLASLTHSMRNRLSEKYLLDPDPAENNGQVPNA